MAEFTCPSCGHEHHITATAHVPDSTRMAFRLTPKPGERMTAGTIGGTLADLDKLNRAVARDLGLTCVTLVDRVEMNDGEITFHLIVTNVARKSPTRPAGAGDAAGAEG